MKITARDSRVIPDLVNIADEEQKIAAVCLAYHYFPYASMGVFAAGELAVTEAIARDPVLLAQTVRQIKNASPAVWNDQVGVISNLWDDLRTDRNSLIAATTWYNRFTTIDAWVFAALGLGITSIGACNILSDTVASSTTAKVMTLVLTGVGGVWSGISNFFFRSRYMETITTAMANQVLPHFVEYAKGDADSTNPH